LREEHEYALRVGGGEITIAPELFRSKGHVYSAGRDHVGVHTYCPDGDRARCFLPVAGRADPVHQYDKAGPVWWFQLVGISNFERLATPEFGQSLLNTLGYTAIVVFLGVPVASVLAAMLSTTKLRFRVFYRAAFFIPVITLPAAIGVLWRWIYNTDYGILNQILRFFGLNGSSWISDPNIALYSIAMVGVWMTVGYNIVIIAAGIQEVP